MTEIRNGWRVALAAVVMTVAVAVTTAGAPPASAAGTFSDDDGNVHEPNIEPVAARGVTGGCDTAGTLFCPATSVRRDQMATFVVNALMSRGVGVPVDPPDAFADDDGSVHQHNVNVAAAMGIVTGGADGQYHPTNPVTRGQMALFIQRAFNLPPVTGTAFTDVPEIYRDAVNALAEAGITSGCNPEGSLYCAGGLVRRDQMATFLGTALARSDAPDGSIEDIDETLPEAQPGDAPQWVGVQTVNTQTMDQWLTAIVHNVGSYWTQTAGAYYGYQPFAYYDWVSPGDFTKVTRCVDTNGSHAVDPASAGFYCSADDTIFIGQEMAVNAWNNVGDFAVAYIVAHEYAHNVQHELGIYRQYGNGPHMELQADCMAGVWANSAYYQNILEAGDIEEAQALTIAIGGTSHGTGEQRERAFLLGYNTGSAANCAPSTTY